MRLHLLSYLVLYWCTLGMYIIHDHYFLSVNIQYLPININNKD